MALADLFNPSFFMFLGILVLVVALLVVYFESKMREQNHKISSMLSLVSTLAEDMNGMKMGLNHLVIRGGGLNPVIYRENLGESDNNNLIEVSDDDDNDDDNDDNDDNDNESQETDIQDELSESDSDENNSNIDTEDIEDLDLESESSSDSENIKVLKLDISNENLDDEENNIDLEDATDLDYDIDELPEVTDDYAEEVLDLKYEGKEDLEENIVAPIQSDLKTISINLGEEVNVHEENIDFKKLQLPKLRSIAVEKRLATNSEASKLKKPELLKLLGAE